MLNIDKLIKVGNPEEPLSEWRAIFWNRSIRIGFFFASLVAMTMIFYNVLIQATINQVNSAEQDYHNLESTKTRLETEYQYGLSYQADYHEIQEFFATVHSFIPTKASFEDFLKVIGDVSQKAEIDMKQIELIGDNKVSIYSELVVKVILRGSFRSFGKFCEELSHSPQLFSVEILEVMPHESTGLLTFTLEVKMPFYTAL